MKMSDKRIRLSKKTKIGIKRAIAFLALALLVAGSTINALTFNGEALTRPLGNSDYAEAEFSEPEEEIAEEEEAVEPEEPAPDEESEEEQVLEEQPEEEAPAEEEPAPEEEAEPEETAEEEPSDEEGLVDEQSEEDVPAEEEAVEEEESAEPEEAPEEESEAPEEESFIEPEEDPSVEEEDTPAVEEEEEESSEEAAEEEPEQEEPEEEPEESEEESKEESEESKEESEESKEESEEESEESEEPEEESEPEAEEEEVQYPAQEFEKSTKHVKVTVAADEGAFPEGTTMKVKEVSDQATLDAISDAVDGEVEQVYAVDITFYNKDGEEIEPLKPIRVTMSSLLVEEAYEPVVVHVDNDGEATVLDDVDVDADEVTFDADSFSIYAVVKTITTEFISHSGAKYDVTVTYGPEANIPEGSWLRVTDIFEDSDEYEEARKAVLADKLAKGETVDLDDFNMAAIDISIIDPYGNEIEPDDTVTVDIKIKKLLGVENFEEIKPTLEVQHHVEVADGVVIEKVFDGKAEGAYEMDTDEEIAKRGIVVDPDSVNEEDFAAQPEEEEYIDLSFDTDVFSTFTISWNNGWATRTVTVHYVDESGNELTISNPNTTFPNITAQSSSPAFLIYDIDGYEYSYTYRNNNTTANRIAPLLTKNGQNHWQYMGVNNTNTTELSDGDNVYVVYTKKPTPTTGGTPKLDEDEEWPEGDDAPQFSKSSKNQGDGTNLITLSIVGGEKPVEKSTPADVIVIVDRSGSMVRNMAGTQSYTAGQASNMNHNSRMWLAADAVNDMANTLLNGENTDVRMALISFSNEATVDQSFTTNYTTFTGKVNALYPEGGTNWEQALQLANQMATDSDRATFVVFVTDGDPTFRMTRGDHSNNNLDMINSTTYSYYRNYHVFGDGQDGTQHQTTVTRCFNAAVPEVTSINENNKIFYAIGISDSVTKVQNLTTQGGVDASHAFIASNEEAMENAFKSITESIKSALGFGDVEITDGITELTNAEMKVMESVDPNSFKYYRWGGEGNKYGADEAHMTEWTTRASDGCAAATYDEDDGAVHWDMGEGFQLEDGVHYVVTFRVWPSQEAYDLVAELNNGSKLYSELSAEEKAQVVEIAAPTATEQGKYALKTNTDTVKATYSQTSETGETVTISGEHDIEATYHEGDIEDMALESMKLKIKKEFEDDLTGGSDREPSVTLVLQRRNAHQDPEAEFEPYAVPQNGTTSANIVLSASNDWTYEIYVAPGFEVDGEVLEHGYDFTITEPNIDYHYGLIEEIINPMVVNGVEKYYGDGYLIDDEDTIAQYVDQSLTAVNRVKSGIDIQKLVYDTDGTTEIYPDTEFTITGKLLGPDGQPYIYPPAEGTYTGNIEDYSGAYDIFVPDTTSTYHYPEHPYTIDGVEYDTYTRTAHKLHFDDSSNISFTLKSGEFVRFINVPDGCTFEFTESTSGLDAQGYQWVSTDAIVQHRTQPNGPFVADDEELYPTVSGQTATLDEPGIFGNKEYAVTYKNKRTIALPKVELVKIDEETEDPLNGAKFTLYADEDLTEPVTVDGNGKEIAIVTGNKENSTGPDGWYYIGVLPAGTYYLVETEAPADYVLDETPIVITVTKGTNSYTVTATKDGESVLTGPTDGLYTITVDDKYNITEVEATKKWVNADGSTTAPNGASVVFTLLADGEATDYTVTLDGTADEEPTGTDAAGYESAGWTATFINLTKYKIVDGEIVEIEYTIDETTGYPGYTESPTTAVENGGEITNTQEKTSADATKAWKNADGTTTAPEGATVVFTLYADGAATDYTVTLDGKADDTPTGTAGYESEAWKATFQNLPKYKIDNGEAVEIEYTIGETTTYAGYTKSPDDPVASGETITNTQEPSDATATKAWKNADGTTTPPEGATVVFTLYADGEATTYTVTLKGEAGTAPTSAGGYESEAWVATFVNLAKYKVVDGEAVEITYTIAETTGYPGYTASTEDPVASGSTITNTQEATSANAKKAWKRADGTTDAPQGGQVTFTLYADGSATDYTVTLDGTAETAPTGTAGYESEAWTASFVNLPKYKIENGEAVEITYTIAETTGYPGYTASTEDPVASGETITNTQEATTADASKVWVNADGTNTAPDGATVTFTLLSDGEATEYTVTLDGEVDEEPTGTAGYESEAWKAAWVNLPKYKIENGEAVEIEYTVDETTTYAGYTKSPEEAVASGGTITNTQEPTSANAKKAWKNADGSTNAPEGAKVTFTLYADGTATEYTVELDGEVDEEPTGTAGYESAAWTATFVNLPKYQPGTTTEIEYTIAETTGYDGYEASTTDPVASGETITNTQEVTTAYANKVWKNADGSTTAPDGASVVFTLYADNEKTDYTVTLDGEVDEKPTVTGGYESAAWTATFVNLPKYQPGTKTEIVYTIAETTGYDGYTASTTDPIQSGGNITNSQDETDANALKAWKNADGSTDAPEGAKVTFTLYADGEATTYTVELDGTVDEEPAVTGGYESEAWKAAFVHLPKYKVGTTTEIVYTVAETGFYAGYTPSTEDPVASGETITNTQEPAEIYATKEWENADGTTTPPEGGKVTFTLYADGAATEYTVELDGEVDTTVPEKGGYESEAWKATFVGFPKYQTNGTTEIVYTIAETTGYTGYKASTTDPVDNGGSITNSQLSAKIKLLKVGDGDLENPLDGVEFELYSVWKGADSADNVKAKNIYGEEVGTIKTADGGLATVGDLLPGTYYLVETKGADGYNMLTEPVEIKIELVDKDPGYTVSYTQDTTSKVLEADTDGAYEVVVSNPSGVELPNAGGSGTFAYTMVGIAMIAAAVLILALQKKRRIEA